MAGTKRRSIRQAASRKRSLYVDPDTDDDFEAQSDDDVRAPSEPPAPPSPKRRKPGPKRKPATRSRTKGRQLQRSVGGVRKPNTSTLPPIKKEFSGPSDQKPPAWISLPVDILREIFIFAAQPAVANSGWLLKAAYTCRAFAIPALEAFYQSPVMVNRLQPHQLLDLLRLSRDEKYIDYNVKIKNLLIDVRCVAGVATNKPPFDLCDLVMQVPQLKTMEILYPKHLPPYRSVEKIQRWTFPTQDLVDALNKRGTRLKGWRWSRDHIPKMPSEDLYNMMTVIHGSRAFEHLERLVISGFNVDDSAEPLGVDDVTPESDDAAKAIPGLANSITELPEIKDLSFICCDLVMNKFLQRLPINLQRLELTNCLEITSDMLRTYFASSGSQLRALTLNHNPALNFSFLTGLRTFCPRLEELEMDLQYYSERDNVNDAEPLYDELLSAGEVPTWPVTLRHLELTHAQRLTAEAAKNLFHSLVDSAIEMPMLRTLILHAHINIPWRDRVGFRDEWIGRLRRVYLRRTGDPIPYLGSFKQHRLWKQAHGIETVTQGNPSSPLTRRHGEDSSGVRELSHVLVARYHPSGDQIVHVDSDPPQTATTDQPRRSRRVAESQISQAPRLATPEADSESALSDEDEEGSHGIPESAVQGLCDVVDIRIDNQRPRETQFTEGDFLDAEASGDEDWREDAEEHDEDAYAW